MELKTQPMAQQDSEYAAPAVELVLTNEDVEREIHYAGRQTEFQPPE